MTNQLEDPYRHWDGSQWLHWDGQIWKPEGDTEVPTAATTAVQPTAVEDATAASNQVAAPNRPAGSGRHRALSPTPTTRPVRTGWLIGGLAVVLLGASGVAFNTLHSDAVAASAVPTATPVIAPPKTLLVAVGTTSKDLVEFTPTSAWTLLTTYNCNQLGGHGAFTLTNVAKKDTVFVRVNNKQGHTFKTLPLTGRIRLKVTSNCVWTVKATQP